MSAPRTGAVFAVDLRKYLDGPPRNREDTDGLPGLQTVGRAFENVVPGRFQPPRNTGSGGVQAIGLARRQPVVAGLQLFPLPAGESHDPWVIRRRLAWRRRFPI